jgi:hypothetical protein
MIFFWVPETKQRTLEELDYIFAVPTRTHMHYQLTKAMPYFFHRYVFRRKDVVLEPLYQFDSARDTDASRIADMQAADAHRAEIRREATNGTNGVENVENTGEKVATDDITENSA